MVGAGPTTALSLHLSAVLTHAQWPTITCHELYKHHLLTERIPCLLYTSDAADEGLGVDLGGRRIIKKKIKEGSVEVVGVFVF